MNSRSLLSWLLVLMLFLSPSANLLAQRAPHEDLVSDRASALAADSLDNVPPESLSHSLAESPAEAPTLYFPNISSTRSGAPVGDERAAPVGASVEVALRYVHENREQWGLSEADVADLVVTDHYTTQHNGVTHTYLRQRYEGIELFGGNLNINIAADGSVLSAHSDFVPNLAEKVNTTEPAISAVDALSYAALHLGVSLASEAVVIESVEGNVDPADDPSNSEAHEVLLSDAGISRSPIPAQLVFEPAPDGIEVRLAWNMSIELTNELGGGDSWPYLRVDAVNGEILSSNDLIVHDSYRVFELPKESPQDGSATLVANPADALASPFGWHDINGVAGAEFTDTRGNNVFAQEDMDANDTGGFRPSQSSSGLVFDYAFDSTLSPSGGSNTSAALVNLFYYTNILHDILYQYGFDEASGNFQQNNYGRGGIGNDAVIADAQDGSGLNNANFSMTLDGMTTRMQMYIWTPADPDRDSAFDSGVVAHEYGHGLSGRLTGGPSTHCLLNEEEMGEGWSDFLALVLTAQASDTSALPRGMGTYVLNQPPTGGGIRLHPYTTDMTINPHTYDSLKSLSTPHQSGSVWAEMLWEMYWGLVNEYGFDANLYTGTGGNNLALQLVIDGLKLQPCFPGFVDGRNAILLADQSNNGGSNQCIIWKAFAKRGLGKSALQGSVDSITDGTQAFDLPEQCAISIRKQAIPSSLYAGQQVTYTVAITNETQTVATSVALTDAVPQAMSYVAASASHGGTLAGDILTWNVGTLNPGQSIVRSFRAVVKPSLVALHFADDMESGSSGWTATGLWHQEQNSAPCGKSHSATTSWYFGHSDSCTYDTGAQSVGSLTLATPIALPTDVPSTLTFWSWEKTEDRVPFDRRVVLVSTDGTNFSPLRELIDERGKWVKVSIDLSVYAGQSVWLRFTFDSVDADSNSFRGWYVDDVKITTVIANTTRATASGVIENAYTLISSLRPAPNVVADSATTNEDTPVNVSVLANDTDVEALPLSVVSVTQPGHGSVTSNGTTVTYTPADNFNGSDSFTYRVRNGQGSEGTGSVNMTITPASDAPATVTINGPDPVAVNRAQSFTATVDFAESQAGPLLPMTFTWQATDLASVVHTGSDSDAVSFTWTAPGSKMVSVSAVNADGEVLAQRSITVRVAGALVVTAIPTLIAANGTSTSTIAATVTGVDGLPVVNQTVSFNSDYGTIAASAQSDAEGVAVATLTSVATVVTATITATIDSITGTAKVIFGGGQLQGRIFRDFNRNGQQESGEPGLAGVVVTLTPQDGLETVSQIAAPTLAAPTFVNATVVTDEGGDYSLTALPFGTYGVTMEAPEGYVFLSAMPATMTIDRMETITLPSRGVIYQIVLPLTKR